MSNESGAALHPSVEVIARGMATLRWFVRACHRSRPWPL